MIVVRFLAAVCLAAVPGWSATFGTVVPLVGGASDLILDEARGRLYLINTNQTRVEVYSTAQRRFLSTIRTEALPLAGAMSRDGQFLYIAAYDASALQVIDLNTQTVVSRVSLPAKPESVAVGVDGRVLISTIGTGQNNLSNVLLIFDPAAADTRSLIAVPLTPPPPASPLLPAPSGRVFLTSRAQLVAARDGRLIIGANIPNATTRALFVYEVASGTVLRSRTVTNVSSVLSVSPDGSRFMAGLTLFDTETLQVLAQQNAANSPYPFQPGTNFNVQQNQGGSVFSPDGTTLYSAFNTAPVQNPPARANVSQLMLNDPENLLIRMGLQLPENLVGKMIVSSDGANAFALSESGFVTLPLSTISQSPLAMPERTVSLLVNDQCGVYRDASRSSVEVKNAGRGRLSVNAQLLQVTPTGPAGIGGAGGAGGGQPGGGVVIVLPTPPAGTEVPVAPTLPGGAATGTNAAVAATAPVFRTQATVEGGRVDVEFTRAAAGRNTGTVSPTHTLLLQSNEAINIPPALRVFQNFRDSDARGEIIPVEVGLSANEAIEDVVVDHRRERLYLANSGMNRVEVFEMPGRRLLAPIRVGQLPRSLAMTADGSTLYVANTGGESISVIDLDKLQVTGRVKFPPLPFNSGAAAMTPSVVAAGLRGLQVIMNNGSIWKVVGNDAVPRPLSPAIGALTVPAPRTMAATPGGEYILLLAGTGNAYLYDAVADEFVQSRQVFSNPIQGFYGPVAAGPRGQYFLANGLVLNQALTPVNAAGTGTGQTTGRPVSAVSAGTANTFIRFSQPVRANANTVVSEPAAVETVDGTSGNVLRSSPAPEGPLTTLVGTARVNVNGRMLALDAGGTTAYAVTASGISVIPLEPVNNADRPAINPNGTVSLSSYLPAFAPGSLVSIFGRNLGSSGAMSGSFAPAIMGGVCVTLDSEPLPLLMTSSGQINAQIPPATTVGRHTLTIRSIDRKAASQAQSIQVSRYAPALFTDNATKEVFLVRADGSRVTRNRPARRDEPLMMFAAGLGVTQGARLASGVPAPSTPLAEADPVEVFFGDPRYSQSEMIVEWAGLVPGFIGVYQVNIRVPGDRMRGEDLPVLLRIGGVQSQITGPVVPVVSVQ